MFSEVSRPAVGPTKTPVPWVAGGWGLSPRIRRPGREGDHASPSSVKFKNNWTYTSTLSYAFIQDFGRETFWSMCEWKTENMQGDKWDVSHVNIRVR